MTTPNQSFTHEIRGLTRPVWILSVGTLIDRFGAFVYPFLILFLTNAGMKPILAGVAAALHGAGSLCAAFVGGYLSDRIGRRRTIGLSMFGGATATILLYAAVVNESWIRTEILDLPLLRGFWASFLLTFSYGLLRGMYHPASSSLLADLTPKNRLVAAFAVLRFAINLGFALGMAAAGVLLHFNVSFLWLFGLDAATSITFGLLATFFLPHGVRSEKENRGWGPAIRSIFRNKAFLLLGLNTFAIAIVFNQWWSSFPYYLKHHWSFPEMLYSAIMALNGLLIVLFELPISAWVRRYSPPRVIAIGSFVATLGFGMIALLPLLSQWGGHLLGIDPRVFVAGGWFVAMAIFTVGEMITLPMHGAWIAALAPQKMRGRYNGANGLVFSIAAILGPIVGISLLEIGTATLCAVLTALGILSAFLLLRFRTA